MADQPKPNWYDDGNGQERWWDGRAWTQHTRPFSTAARDDAVTAVLDPHTAAAPSSVDSTTPIAGASPEVRSDVVGGSADRARARRSGRSRKPSSRLLIPVVVAIVAFLMGTGVGQAGHAAPEAVEATTTPAFAKLESALTAMKAQRDGLQQKIDDADAQASALETRTSELDAREADLDTKKEQLDARSKKLDKREAKLASASESSSSASNVADSEPENVYYANCAAARAAGAAPVRVGDPGYSRKLDRDGDGVGCE